MDNSEVKHVRRERYKGTHPKTYQAKYKELNPDKYAETIAKVIEKGSTPAGMHRSICVDEILEFFKIQPGQLGLDVTLGYGGHTLEMLKLLEGQGHLVALDVDTIEMPRTKERLEKLGFNEEMLAIKELNFSNIDQVVEEFGLFDFILADLGVSSMQIDNPERGFSYKTDGPLDLRMNPKKGTPASVRLMSMTQDEMEGMFTENADEPHAREIAFAISQEIKNGKVINTTTELQTIIKDTLSFLPERDRKDEIKKACQRCFQALRIDVNHEFESLYTFLEKLPQSLKPNGKVAILSFHSGEDRMVKKAFKYFLKDGLYSSIAPEPIRPSFEECNTNSRAKSAKLRWAIKS